MFRRVVYICVRERVSDSARAVHRHYMSYLNQLLKGLFVNLNCGNHFLHIAQYNIQMLVKSLKEINTDSATKSGDSMVGTRCVERTNRHRCTDAQQTRVHTARAIATARVGRAHRVQRESKVIHEKEKGFT